MAARVGVVRVAVVRVAVPRVRARTTPAGTRVAEVLRPGPTPLTPGPVRPRPGAAPEPGRKGAAPMSETTPTRYRFGPLERRGLVAGWRGGQIGAVAIALIIGVGVVRASASPLGVVVALAVLAVGVGVATWPISGRTAEEWAPHVLRHAARRGRRSRDRTSPFAGVHLIEVDPSAGGGPGRGGGRGIGVIHDRTRRTFTAVLGVADPGFVLLGDDDKVRRVTACGRECSPPWHATGRRCTACNGWSASCPATRNRSFPEPTPRGRRDAGYDAACASYDALVRAEAHASLRHEVFLAVSVHAGRAARAVKAVGGGDKGACALLLREVAALRRRLTDASIEVGAVLAPDELAAIVRGAYDGRAGGLPVRPSLGASIPVRCRGAGE